MDALQVAGHLSLEFNAAVEGPFTGPHKGDQVARVWLANKRGISLMWKADTGRIDMITIRETVPLRDVTYDGTPWRTDQSTPVVNGGESAGTSDVVLKAARKAVAVLRDLPAIDPRDQHSTRRTV
jgi:hypothetical protein